MTSTPPDERWPWPDGRSRHRSTHPPGRRCTRCLTGRETAHTLNPHVIVTRVTSGRDTAADSSYLTRLLAPAGATPATCRQTRLTELVNDLDPKLTAVALGMNNNGLVRYAADNVARDRLQRRLASPP